jgi:dihydrofolate synthase / folylpolyglutamate synthase
MAFDHFASEQVDIAVIETGLGGRLDSTNIITPEVSVITNIGWDHMSLLGNTLPLIAGEKAGIIKHGIPAVIGETQPETAPVFREKAASAGAPIFFADQERYAADWSTTAEGMSVVIANSQDGEHQSYALDLAGQYQTRNLVTVLGAVQQLRARGWDIPKERLMAGLAHVRTLTGLHGRWEKIHDHPPVILDVAHNTDGMKQVAAQIELSDFGRLHIVTGMVKDKDVRKVLAILPREARFYFTQANIPRALPAEQLAAIGRELGLEGEVWPDVNSALAEAFRHARARDMILVCGSFFIVGEVDRTRLGQPS